MSEPAPKRSASERSTPDDAAPGSSKTRPTLSLSELKDSAMQQPFQEKLFTWGGVIFVGASTLPWTAAGSNGWSSSGLLFVSLSAFVGLALHLLSLQDIGPGNTTGFWKIYRYVACVQLVVFGIYVMTRIPYIGSDWGFGLLLACMGFCAMMTSLYRILEARDLLPIRITR